MEGRRVDQHQRHGARLGGGVGLARQRRLRRPIVLAGEAAVALVVVRLVAQGQRHLAVHVDVFVIVVVIIGARDRVADESQRRFERLLGREAERRVLLADLVSLGLLPVAGGECQRRLFPGADDRGHLEVLEVVVLARRRLEAQLVEVVGNEVGGLVEPLGAQAPALELVGSEVVHRRLGVDVERRPGAGAARAARGSADGFRRRLGAPGGGDQGRVAGQQRDQ